MLPAFGKTDGSTKHDSGVGRVRERTIVLGNTLIAIDNIGTIQILDVDRDWSLGRLGALIFLAGPATMVLSRTFMRYSGDNNDGAASFLMIAGIVLIVITFLQPRRKGLSIGTCDGRVSSIISKDRVFLQRLLDFLTEKINSRNDGLTASFDITHNNFHTGGGAVAIGDNAIATGVDNSISSNGGGVVLGNGSATGAGGHMASDSAAISIGPAAAPPPAPQPAADPDDALFADEPQPAPAPAPPPPVATPAEPPRPARTLPAAARRPRDPLLDGPAATDEPEEDDSWLNPPTRGRTSYRAQSEGGGSARWLVPLLLLIILAGGGFAGWYFYTQSQGGTSVSLVPAAPDPSLVLPAEPVAATPASAEIPAAPAPEPAPATPPPEAAPIDPLAAEATSAPLPLTAPPLGEITDFTPPEPFVARASGLRYRARPSAADDVQIIAETRAGGEPLSINGRTQQADGEWYRVAMPDGRPAWFKASLAVPRARFAETFNAGSPAGAPFAAAAPRILEPAEGVQLPGGPQPVRLAWQAPPGASIHVVEIEAYDAITKRWIEDPVHKRVTVESMEELAESIPRTGAWRWRVRAVSPAGEQSQFSRWSAFGVRD